jgi:hypothetical protein
MSVPRIAAIVVARFFVLPLAASLLLAWWLLGDVSEQQGDDAILTLPFAEAHATTMGLVGIALAAVAVTDWVLRWRNECGRPPARLLVLATAVGSLIGMGLRLVTARVVGANIGGGIVILFGPAVVFPLLVIAALDVHSVARAGARPTST